jgi:Ornithine cyclodeaminase/mu-crystallin family
VLVQELETHRLEQASHNVVVPDRPTVAQLLPRSIGFDLASLALKESHPDANAKLVVHAGVETAMRGADIICTLTSAPSPLLLGRFLEPGQHVNAVGSSVRQFRESTMRRWPAPSFTPIFYPCLLAEGGEYQATLASGARFPQQGRSFCSGSSHTVLIWR